MGIAAGTSATTFDPSSSVTREQMASFLARTINVAFSLQMANPDVLVCNVPFNQPGAVCTGSIAFPAGRTFTVREGWVYRDPSILPGGALFVSTGFQLHLDGTPVPVAETQVTMEGLAFQLFSATFAGGLTGTHTLEGRWTDGGVVDGTITLTVNFLG